MAKRKRNKPQSGVRFARVPSGGETCPFCIMLASRGAVYYSEQTAGADGHYHANCRCRIVPSWGLAEIEGYDPDLYYDMWKHPEKYAKPEDGTSVAAELAEQVTPQAALSQAQKDVLEWYVSGEGMYINQGLRGRGITLNQWENKQIAMIDSAINASPALAEQTLYRAVDAQAIFGQMSQLKFEQLRDAVVYGDKYAEKQVADILKSTPGKVITEQGFMSTTEDADIATGWQGFTGSDKDIALEIHVPKGTKGAKIYDLFPDAEEKDPQREVLLERGLKYKVDEIKSRDGVIYVIVSLLKQRIT